jgi:membrane protein involved in colicin uptake
MDLTWLGPLASLLGAIIGGAVAVHVASKNLRRDRQKQEDVFSEDRKKQERQFAEERLKQERQFEQDRTKREEEARRERDVPRQLLLPPRDN